MDKLINKTVDTTFEGVDGNAFNLMAHFRKNARRQGWTPEEIQLVLEDAMSSDYDHLVATLHNYLEHK